MPTPSGSAFHCFYNGQTISVSGGPVPDPIVLGVSYPIIDGKVVEVTATSGSLQYLIVEPGDYPTTEMEARKRAGSVPGK